MNPVANYLALRQAGFCHRVSAGAAGISKAWALQKAKSALTGLLLAACVLYLISDRANAFEPDAKVIARQAEYIKALEKIVSLCFGDKEQAVFVGGELHLCRAVPTGVMQ
jgi:hypothetical protein